MLTKRQSKAGAAAGFSLIEILVSVLVLSAGVLGAAALQLAALRTGQQSGQHTTAMQLAADIAERIRANVDQLRLEDGDNDYLGFSFDADEAAGVAPRPCYDRLCDPEELAAFDLYEWQRRLAASLPAARAVICRDGEPWNGVQGAYRWGCDERQGSAIVIKIGWQSRGLDGGPASDGNAAPGPGIVLMIAPYRS